jgi:hypothetical protein
MRFRLIYSRWAACVWPRLNPASFRRSRNAALAGVPAVASSQGPARAFSRAIGLAALLLFSNHGLLEAVPILKIIHGWPDQPEAQDALIRQLKGQGFGGVVCNVSFDQYLASEGKWKALVRAVTEAKQAGMTLWLYDERGYPSGNAGGIVLREHPAWEAEGLLVADQECQTGPVALTVPPGKLFLAAAFPWVNGSFDPAGRTNLEACLSDGKLRWTAPAGRWRVMAVTETKLYEGTHAEGNLAEKMPYVNLLRPEPTARFLEVTHQAYADRLDPNLGKYFEAAFTDEPSLMSLYLKPMPWRPLPWAPNLPVEFQKRRGYALDATVIPALISDMGARGQKQRYDFWLTVGELVSENYFGQIQQRCRQLRVPSGGHMLMEEGLTAQVALYGDFFRCARRFDAPGIDCLTSIPSEVPWQIAKFMSSVAELEGRALVMSETSDHSQVYRPAGDTRPKRVVTEGEIRGTCNRLLVNGVNRITSYYSFTGLEDEALRRINTWVDRCSEALTGGYEVADIGLVYPVESLWPKFIPARHWANASPEASRVESTYHTAAESLFNAQRDFVVLDSRALLDGKARRETLTHGKLAWRVVVLPGVDTLPVAAWENLGRFTRQGGVVIALGALPKNSETEFPSKRVLKLAREMFGATQNLPKVNRNAQGGAGIYLPAGSESMLPLVLQGVLEPAIKISGNRPPVRMTHRRIQNREVYFVINDNSKPWQGEIELPVQGKGERWNPAADARVALTGGQDHLELESYGGVFYYFDRLEPAKRLRLESGSLPNLKTQALPQSKMNMGKGEFVQAELAPDSARSNPDKPVWKAQGVLTKSKVDTFLFVSCRFDQPLDLSQADCLAFETWVPGDQKTGGQLLFILQAADGAEFLASSGRSLAVAGREESYLPWGQFQRAGWSKGGNSELDLSKITEIRVGWGGYYGTEGENIEFSFGLPRLGKIDRK